MHLCSGPLDFDLTAQVHCMHCIYRQLHGKHLILRAEESRTCTTIGQNLMYTYELISSAANWSVPTNGNEIWVECPNK